MSKRSTSERSMFMRIAQNPALYATWSLIVIAALVATYFGNPYVFGFTTLGLMWLSIAVLLIGVIVVFVAKGLSASARVTIIATSLVALAAALIAIAVLGTFNWA